ncbi:MAG: hypothetical protein ACREPB_15990, partial [Arenimonas sp.]
AAKSGKASASTYPDYAALHPGYIVTLLYFWYRLIILAMDELDTDSRVATFREEYRAAEIRPGYHGGLHFATTNTIVLSGVALCIWYLHDVQAWELWAIPLTFIYSNISEYLGHRFVMHHPRPGFGLMFKRHVKQHHRFFTHSTMPVDSIRDFKVVLFPPFVIAFFLLGFGTPLALLIAYLAGSNAALLFVITGLLYFLNYEYLHLAYHLPNGHWVSRLPIVSRMRRLHQAHHDQSIMTACNFNITYPIGDWLFRTLR